MGKLRDIWLVMTGRLSSDRASYLRGLMDIQDEQITTLCEQLHKRDVEFRALKRQVVLAANDAANLDDNVGAGEVSHGVVRGPGLFQARRPPDGTANDP